MFSLSPKSISCPVCSHTFRLTDASFIQSFELGVFCECQVCSHGWIFKLGPEDDLDKLLSDGLEEDFLVMINLSDPKSREYVEELVEDEGFESVSGFFDIDEIFRLDRTRLGCLIQNIDDLNHIDEYDFCKLLHLDRFVRTIVYSHNGDRDRTGRYLQQGAFDFLTDPIDADRLRIRLTQAIVETERRRMANRVSTVSVGHSTSEDR